MTLKFSASTNENQRERERDLDQIALIKRNTQFFTPPLHWNKISKYENNNINK